jgi:hypothetical protein
LPPVSLTPVANLPPVSLTLVVHLYLWISPQIFKKIHGKKPEAKKLVTLSLKASTLHKWHLERQFHWKQQKTWPQKAAQMTQNKKKTNLYVFREASS